MKPKQVKQVIIELRCTESGCEYKTQLDVSKRELNKVVLLIQLYRCPAHAEADVDKLDRDGLR